MFLEPFYKGQRSGWVEVICGSMFSGKTEELLRRLRRAQFANQPTVLFKPSKDTRYHVTKVVSHNENEMDGTPVQHSSEMLKVDESIQVIGIDEAQFFDLEVIQVCQELALRGKRVVIAGLDMDFRGLPFGPMPGLLAVAEYLTKVHAICPHCGNLATHSYRFTDDQNTVVLGAKDIYEPRCRLCYSMGPILDFTHIKRNESKETKENPQQVELNL